MNRGFDDWCSFKYEDRIYDERQMRPSLLWIIGSDDSEGVGLIVANETGMLDHSLSLWGVMVGETSGLKVSFGLYRDSTLILCVQEKIYYP